MVRIKTALQATGHAGRGFVGLAGLAPILLRLLLLPLAPFTPTQIAPLSKDGKKLVSG